MTQLQRLRSECLKRRMKIEDETQIQSSGHILMTIRLPKNDGMFVACDPAGRVIEMKLSDMHHRGDLAFPAVLRAMR